MWIWSFIFKKICSNVFLLKCAVKDGMDLTAMKLAGIVMIKRNVILEMGRVYMDAMMVFLGNFARHVCIYTLVLELLMHLFR